MLVGTGRLVGSFMDISYLVWLQGVRDSLPVFFEQLFLLISAIATSKALIVIPCLLFWCLDKRAGQYVLFSFSLGNLVNQFIKNTACVYRPWIRDAAVQPVQAALPEATGYSFPSGHSVSAATLIGALGWNYRKRWPLLNVLCWVFVALVVLSRNILGVHTPQDVLVGLLEGVLLVIAVERLLVWIDERAGRDLVVLIVAVAVGVAYVAYVALKPYPLDYSETGELLVDPVAMQVDCFKSAGVFFGAVTGWFLERRFLAFEVDPKAAGVKRMVVRFAIGFAVVAVFHVAPRLLLSVGLDERWFELVKNGLTVFAAAFAGPAAFCAVERKLYGGRQ